MNSHPTLSEILVLGTILVLTSAALAQNNKASPKITPADVRVLPFCGTQKSLKLDPKASGMFDELTVTKSERLHIHGTKRHDTGKMNGQVVYFLGKLALIRPGDRAGKLNAKFGSTGSNDPVRRYYISLDLPNSLDSAELVLANGKTYEWAVTSDGTNTTIRVTSGKDEVASLRAATAQVQGFGFGAVVRFVKNEADLEVTFD